MDTWLYMLLLVWCWTSLENSPFWNQPPVVALRITTVDTFSNVNGGLGILACLKCKSEGSIARHVGSSNEGSIFFKNNDNEKNLGHVSLQFVLDRF